MNKVIINQEVFNSLHYPFYTLKKILKSKGFDLNRAYTRIEEGEFNRITFTQNNEPLECSS